MAFSWTSESVSKLTALWSEKLPLRQIAAELGTTYKSASSKVRRLGLGEQSAPLKIDLGKVKRIGRTCMWPVGDPSKSDFHFCGAKPVATRPYCLEHAQVAYQKARPTRNMGPGR